MYVSGNVYIIFPTFVLPKMYVNRNTSVFQESARTSANVANHSVAETEKLDLEISKLTDALYQEKEKAEEHIHIDI